MTAAGGWAVIVPLKPAVTGKSRLGAAPGLARAIGVDTVAAAAAATAVGTVIVVTADAATAREAETLSGVTVVPETAPEGLDGAVALGAAAVGAERPRAALLGDLPALRPEELDAALAAASSVDRAVMADRDGTGSTLVTARAGVPWASAFGAGSLRRHLDQGCVPLSAPVSSGLRQDVDTAADLAAAVARGVGPRTAAALLRSGTG